MRNIKPKIGLTLPSVILIPAATITAHQALGNTSQRSGEEAVKTVRARCHGAGKNGAPRIGDVQARSKRAAQGLSGLEQHAITVPEKCRRVAARPT
ncbi:MAG TPA: hypothetical protein VMV91_11930 [Rhodocyclaceae bacterium]|nr:hypothetical protein [Rhodocyclaceae bacterium]